MSHHTHIITITSFGFKHAESPKAALLFDARCLPNPFWEEPLKPLSGLEQSIQDYFKQFKSVQQLIQSLEDYTALWLTEFETSLPEQVSIAIGCTGGQHRSVYVADTLAKKLQHRLPAQFSIQAQHRDQQYWNQCLPNPLHPPSFD